MQEPPEHQPLSEPDRPDKEASKDPIAGASAAPGKCPPRVKALITQALASHLREEGNCNWGVVREKLEFAPYIGAIAGETGKKRFQRWKKKLSRPLPKDRTRPHEARPIVDAQYAWAAATANATEAPDNMLALTVRQIMGKGLTALRGYEHLAARLQQASDDLERIRQAALVLDPDGLDGLAAGNPELLLKVARENRELVQTMTAFVRQYTQIWKASSSSRTWLSW
jgi:hypothetical protein